MPRSLRTLVSLLLGSLICTPAVFAQVRSTGTVVGVVKDESGAVIPAADVTLQNIDTGSPLRTHTNGSGDYSFPVVSAGRYTLTVSRAGFKTSTHAEFPVSAVENVRVDVVLTIGQVSQQVSVTAAPPAVDTVTASEGNTVTGTQANELPLDTRVFTQLVLLEPGVSSSLVQT